MAVTTDLGRAHIAALYKQSIENGDTLALLAVGRGVPHWGRPQLDTLNFGGGETAQLQYAPKGVVSLRSLNGETIYSTDDFYSDATGLVTRIVDGSVPAAEDVVATYTAAIGRPSRKGQALESEIGRTRINSVDFVTPLDQADNSATLFIESGDDRYVRSETPTPWLSIVTRLGVNDAVGDPITEYGVFIDCEVDPELPPLQRYYAADQITNSGIPLLFETRTPMPHDGTLSAIFSVILEV